MTAKKPEAVKAEGNKPYLNSKTVIGATIVGLIEVMQTMGWLDPGSMEKLAQVAQVVGAVLGIVGVRDAIRPNLAGLLPRL